MALEIMRDDVRIIQGLSDYPNQEEGLSSGQMKAKFDEAAVMLQSFINGSIVPAVNDKLSASELSGAVADTVEQTLGSITPDKIGAAPESHVSDKSNPHDVTADQIGAAPAVESSEYPGCYYRTVSGVTEWLNPPMVIGTEYRTTERYLGKAVYVKAVSLGNLPNAATKQVRYATPRLATNILNVRGCAMNESGKPQPLPLDYNGLLIEVHANTEFVFLRTIVDNTAWTAVALVKYTLD